MELTDFLLKECMTGLKKDFEYLLDTLSSYFFEISRGNLVSQYMLALSGRMNKVLGNSARKNLISKRAACQGLPQWNEVGIVFVMQGCTEVLPLVGLSSHWFCNGLRPFSLSRCVVIGSTVSQPLLKEDPGLDGCLLELEEILTLELGNSICSSLFSLTDASCMPEELIDLHKTNNCVLPLSRNCF